MGSGSLQGGKLHRSCLVAQSALDKSRQIHAAAGKLFVSEHIHSVIAVAVDFTDKPAVCQMNTLGNRNDNGFLFRRQFFYFFQESINVKVHLRQINGIHALAGAVLCQCGSRCQPAGISAHDFRY